MEAYSEMRNENRTILEVKNLKISFDTPAGEVQAVRGVNLAVKEGEVLALVGESGCGKSVLCKSMMKLLPASARIKEGQIFADGVDITGYRERDMVRLRGSFFSMVFQDPMTALDPTMTVGRQIAEAVKVHEPKLSKAELDKRVAELMELVGIEDAWAKAELFPYHFSGGMRQRAVLAVALAGNPSVLIADEPTTALDVTIQAQILDLFREIQKERHTATVFVTHDLGVVARVADRVAVMYAGKIVETGTVEDIFSDAKHPYTRGLLRSLPFYAKGKKELYTIPPTNKHAEETVLRNHHDMLCTYHNANRKYLYPYCVGGKTGYTATANSTLVTYAEKDGMTLICVVMNTQSPNQFIDTVNLFDYAFDNFQVLNVSENDTDYSAEATVDNGNLNNIAPFVELDKDAVIVLPKTAEFSDTSSSVEYNDSDPEIAGSITYTYAGRNVGKADIKTTGVVVEGYAFDNESTEEEEQEAVSTVQVKPIVVVLLIVAVILLGVLLFFLKRFYDNYYIIKHNRAVRRDRKDQRRRIRKKRRRRRRWR